VKKTASLDDSLLDVIDATLNRVFNELGAEIVFDFLRKEHNLKQGDCRKTLGLFRWFRQATGRRNDSDREIDSEDSSLKTSVELYREGRLRVFRSHKEIEAGIWMIFLLETRVIHMWGILFCCRKLYCELRSFASLAFEGNGSLKGFSESLADG
jgi:hypothetical protein